MWWSWNRNVNNTLTPRMTNKIDISSLLARRDTAPLPWQTKLEFGGRPAVSMSHELKRILELPRRDRFVDDEQGQELIELVTARYSRRNSECVCRSKYNRECIKSLRLVQAWALLELESVAGLLGPIGTGHGKTVLDILAPLAVPDCKVAVLLVPPKLVGQLQEEYEMLEQHFRVPTLYVNSATSTYHKKTNEETVLYVVPYSKLSSTASTALMSQLGADLIISDECQLLRHPNAVRTSRFLRYMGEHQATRFAGWSGSITESSIKDFAHLSALALRHGSPLPVEQDVVNEWATALDPSAIPAPAGALLKMCEPGEHIHSGFHRRLVDTLGIVSTVEPSCDAKLIIVERKAPEIPDSIADALKTLRDEWIRPDGEELIEPLEWSKCAVELACGFFYRWVFPRGESIKQILIWLEARKTWRRAVRDKLKRSIEHLDSPALLEAAAARAWGDIAPEPQLPSWKAPEWPQWRDVRDTVKPETEAVRISDYLAQDAAKWAVDNVGVVWYSHSEFGRWVSSIAELPMHGGGPEAGVKIRAERGDRSIVASIKAHGTGTDGLQWHFNRALIANPPSSNTMWEQCLDSETEVLTNSGWMGIDDSCEDVKIASYSIEDGSIKWMLGERVERRLGKESMWGVQNPHLDIRVTAGHRMICERYRRLGDGGRQGSYYSSREFVNAEDMPLHSRIPVAGHSTSKGISLCDAEIMFLGLFMTDGHLDVSNNTINLFQSEKNPEIMQLIEQTLKECAFPFRRKVNTKDSNFGPRSPLHCWIINKGTANRRGWGALETYVGKDMPDTLSAMNTNQLRTLIKGMWAGDGNKKKGTYSYDRYEPHTYTITSRRKNVLDKLQALCVTNGMRCNVSGPHKNIWQIHISNDEVWSVSRYAGDTRPVWKQSDSNPNERVWCVTVPTGAIVTRRNGKVAIVGNCIGRLHRIGQKSPTVLTEFYRHTPELAAHIDTALERANYVGGTWNSPQKLKVGWI